MVFNRVIPHRLYSELVVLETYKTDLLANYSLAHVHVCECGIR